MVKFFKLVILAAVAMHFVGVDAFADEEKKTKRAERMERVRAEINEKFGPTGQSRSCVSVNRLGQSRILDDKTIFFRFSGNRGHMNNLPRKCHGLFRENRFSYRIGGGTQLCRGEIITVLDSFGHTLGSCSLGDFEIWKSHKLLAEEKADGKPQSEQENPGQD